MVSVGEAIREVVERMRQRADDPVYQARLAEMMKETEEQARVRAESERKLWLVTSGVPRSAWDLLDAPDPTKALAEVESFLADPRQRFLTLAGPRGRGKTTAAAVGCYRRRGRFVDAHDLVRAGTFERSMWDDLATTPLLVVDELGSEYANDSFRADFYGLMNKRQGNLRQTVIVTNLDGTAFAARYLAGPMDRLEDRVRNYGRWVTLPGESMRTHWSEDAH